MSRLHWVIVIALLSPAAVAAPQAGPSIEHSVRSGDSLELLAAEYYGDRRHAVFLMVANGLDHARPLREGEKLRIPMNRRVTAEARDSWKSLANSHLADARRAEFLAEFNGESATSSLATGQVIDVPLYVTHTAAGTERVEAIAAAYFGDRKHAAMLAEFNFLTKEELSAGETLTVPIIHVRVQVSKLPAADAESQRRTKRRAEMLKRANTSLPSARAAWRQGDFAAVKRLMVPIETEYVDAKIAADVGVLLGSAYVAFDDIDSALATFGKVVARTPTHSLSASAHSPTVRDVWKRAGGKTHSK